MFHKKKNRKKNNFPFSYDRHKCAGVASLDLRAPEREAGSGGQGKRCAGSGAKG